MHSLCAARFSKGTEYLVTASKQHEKEVTYDGKIISNQGKEIRVDAQKLSGLHTALQDHGYFDMQDDYTLSSNCRDCFTFTITVQNGNQMKSVRADEGTSNFIHL